MAIYKEKFSVEENYKSNFIMPVGQKSNTQLNSCIRRCIVERVNIWFLGHRVLYCI